MGHNNMVELGQLAGSVMRRAGNNTFMFSPLTLDSNSKWLRSKGRSRNQKQSSEEQDNVLHGDGLLLLVL
jgi:hypothetical protein